MGTQLWIRSPQTNVDMDSRSTVTPAAARTSSQAINERNTNRIPQTGEHTMSDAPRVKRSSAGRDYYRHA